VIFFFLKKMIEGMPSFFPKELIFFDLLLPRYGNFQGRDRGMEQAMDIFARRGAYTSFGTRREFSRSIGLLRFIGLTGSRDLSGAVLKEERDGSC
jgi:hypothetical protein